jgi:hypothetical protein
MAINLTVESGSVHLKDNPIFFHFSLAEHVSFGYSRAQLRDSAAKN